MELWKNGNNEKEVKEHQKKYRKMETRKRIKEWKPKKKNERLKHQIEKEEKQHL